ncbi:Lactotransferrin [Tupaia chinensis]|uniref:Lactotransferrin n=1 Tax=Tupaia chinensis TaxID=246437 RepID=L8Y4U5_TUPCH|nr:Lactotransferrin [Tupaia chinensis]
MRLVLPALLFLGALGLCLAAPKRSVRWCTISQDEANKCTRWQRSLRKARGPSLSCIRKTSYPLCIQAIAASKADAVTLDGGWVYEAGLNPYKLRPVAAEVYGSTAEPRNYYYAVAIVRKDSDFQLNQLQGLRSCHTGLNRTAGWSVPIGILRPYLNWTGPPTPLEEAVSKFFSASCIPGVDGSRFPNLCSLCTGPGASKCAASSLEPYFGYSGAVKCLRDGAGHVAFARASTVFEDLPDKAERDQYELLCPDNTRKSVDRFKECHLARVPSHAVMARSVDGREDAIWELLRRSQEKFGKEVSSEFQIFNSPRGSKDLLFKDSTLRLLRVPPRVDTGLYLGYAYYTALRNLRESEAEVAARRAQVVWCAVGAEELRKCQQWSSKGDADALSMDGGLIYVAGKCGLVPVLAENARYLAVAVVRKSDADITWNSLRGRKSCHTAMGRTAGWNIPMGLLFNQTHSCRFGEFFSQSCAPGSDPGSSLCALCVGDDKGEGKCLPNSVERYFGYTGAFRCLAEKAGEVAFLKDVTVLQNTNGNNPEEWAKDLKLEDFELLCLDGTRKPVTEAASCHLARAPSHAVVSREDKAVYLEQVLLEQQSQTKNLLFNDNTECLAKLQGKNTYEEHLGAQYVTAIANLRQCSASHGVVQHSAVDEDSDAWKERFSPLHVTRMRKSPCIVLEEGPLWVGQTRAFSG